MLQQLRLNNDAVSALLTEFIRSEITRVGMRDAVIGLSGGVDSALAAWLAARALGPEHVHCVMMPYRTSSSDSLIDAERVVSILGVSNERVDISDAVDALVESDPGMESVRRGNIMARVRMILLYDRSARMNALVVGTGNKTELLLGYSTQHGDAACAINPLGDLYKSQVWKLARHLGVPSQIVEKAPSADLWEGQTDEAELGFTYKQADELLYFLVDERRSTAELMDMGFEAPFIERIRTRIRRSQYKRRPAIIAKVGQRTINADFRYPRDWGA